VCETDYMPCSIAVGYKHFREPEDRGSKVLWNVSMLVFNCNTRWHPSPEDLNLNASTIFHTSVILMLYEFLYYTSVRWGNSYIIRQKQSIIVLFWLEVAADAWIVCNNNRSVYNVHCCMSHKCIHERLLKDYLS